MIGLKEEGGAFVELAPFDVTEVGSERLDRLWVRVGWPDGGEWAVEVKRSLAPKVERGLRSALSDLEPERSFVVYPGPERFRLGPGIEAIDLAGLCDEVESRASQPAGRARPERAPPL